MDVRKLSEVPLGQETHLLTIDDSILKHKLLTLGFLRDAALTVVRKSIFGASYYVKVDNQCVALRREELNVINVRY